MSLTPRRGHGLLLIVALLLPVGYTPAGALPGSGSAVVARNPVPAPAPDELTIERLYSVPRIIGTAPRGVAWSPDSTRFAFLWNDEGASFLDVWVVSTSAGNPTRVTRWGATDVRPMAPEGTRPGDVGEAAERRLHSGVTDAVARARQSARDELDGGVEAAQWYPDGGHLLVTMHGQLYRVAAEVAAEAGESSTTPVALGIRGRQARWSPAGDSLAYLSGGDLWRVSRAGADLGPAVNLTRLGGAGQRVARYLWSPDGRHLAVLVRDTRQVQTVVVPDYLGEATTAPEVPRPFPGDEPGRLRLLVLDAADGAARRMQLGTDDRDPVMSMAWSADGRRLLIDKSDLYVRDRRVLSVDVSTGESVVLYREAEPDNVMASWKAAWAPDGGIVFLSDRADFYHLYHLAPGAEQPAPLTRGDWAVADFAVTPAGTYVVANAAHPAQRDIYRVGTEGTSPQRLSGRDGTHTPTYSPDGRWAAVLFSSDAEPPDLYLNRLDAPGERRLTRSPLPEFAEHEWVTPEYVTFPSHVDGTLLRGRLLLPPGYDPSRRYPAIIGSIYSNTLRNQWGGRNAHPTWGLDQVLLRRGYVLLNVNIRGSWGQGRAFRRRMKADYGGIDTDDILSGVHYLRTLGSIDMDRVGIWGSSYGGLLTAMSLFKHPGVFAAGVAGAPATNVWHALTGEMRVMGRPQDAPAAYAASSAFTHAAALQDPLMIIHGMRDRIVLYKDSLVLLDGLMALGKADLLDLVTLPGAPHGWDTREDYQTRYAFERLIGHFDRYLRPGGDVPAPAPAPAGAPAAADEGLHEAADGTRRVHRESPKGDQGSPQVDEQMVARIRAEGLECSQLADMLSYMTDVLGARLTASPGMRRAQRWAVGEMRRIGLSNVAIEPYMDYGITWSNDYVSLHLLEPDYQPMVGYPLSHTPGTDGVLRVSAVLADGRTQAELDRLHGKLRGKAVLSTPPARIDLARLNAGVAPWTDEELHELEQPAPERPRRRRESDPEVLTEAQRMAFFKAEGAAVVLESRSGWPGAVRGFGRPGTKTDHWGRQASLDSPPIVAVTPEHYNRMVRILQRGIDVRVQVEVRNAIGPDGQQAANVLGEIPGSDLADEVVMLGAHFDTWHASPNASDNTSGVAVMLEAARILTTLGVQPRRTIRLALWSGEEQGLFGSRAYVRQHFGDPNDLAVGTTAAYDKFSVYFNQDYGPGRYRGIYLQGNEKARPLFTAWMAPFRDLGMTTVSPRGVGSTDHVAFDAVGLPGFQFLQDRAGSTGGHTNLDFFDTLPLQDLRQNAVIVAAFVYHAAMLPDRMPRKDD